MSWSEAGTTGRFSRKLALAAVLTIAGLAGGCFRPLYAENTASTQGGSVKQVLRGVEVPEIKGMLGHYLRNELVFALDGSGDPDAQKTLRLTIGVSESLEVLSVDYANGRADSAVLVATARWSLAKTGSSDVVTSGESVVRVPYERSPQRFASLRAARDAQTRAAKTLADLIRNRIAADLTAS